MKIISILIVLAGAFSGSVAQAYSVATVSPYAAQTALQVLKSGGNAVDATIAATFVLNVVQPPNIGIGGGGFFLASKNGKLSLWDSREMAPSSAHEKMFLDSSGKPIKQYPDAETGPNPVGVPGLVAGLWEAHAKLGSKPWKQLLQPAIRLAHEGIPVGKLMEEMLAGEWERVAQFPTTAALFGDGHGSHLHSGNMLRNPLLAKTLETIAEKGAPEFYRGALAKSWTTEARKFGVKITLEDLKNYKVRVAKPVEYKAFGLRFVTAAPPSAAGLMVGGSLRFIEHYYRSHEIPAPNSAKRVIISMEAFKYFQELRNKTIADPPHGKLDPRKWLGSADEKAAWTEIEKRIKDRLGKIETAVVRVGAPDAARSLAAKLGSSTLEPEGSHTAQVSVVDDRGMAVSYTGTIEEIFGSGITVPQHGFLLNNELSDFSKETGLPNSPAPGKRPRSNMSPHLVFDAKGKLLGAIGCAGGGKIPLAIFLALENFLVHKMPLREAVAFTRAYPAEGKLLIERTLPEKSFEQLKEADYEIVKKEVYGYPQALGGTMQAIMRRTTASSWEAVSEPRAEGMAVVH